MDVDLEQLPWTPWSQEGEKKQRWEMCECVCCWRGKGSACTECLYLAFDLLVLVAYRRFKY